MSARTTIDPGLAAPARPARPRVRSRSVALRTIVVALAASLAACGSTQSQTVFEDPATLHAERDEWRLPREGTAVLRFHVEGIVDSRPDPGRATSSLVIHLVAARFSGPLVNLELAIPAGAKRIATRTRLLVPGAPDVVGDSAAETRRPSDIDPSIELANLTLPTPPEGALVEAILHYELQGTLTSDARWLGFTNAPVGEMLLRYSLPDHATGTLTTTLPGARPITTSKDGRTLIAVFAQDLAPLPADPTQRALSPESPIVPLSRYVTIKAAPLGYAQDFASSWTTVAGPYIAGVAGRSDDLTDGYAVPHKATDADDALAWVQARPDRPDAFAIPWNAPAVLPKAIATNTLSAVDKTHLMAWLLREAKIPYLYAMGRPAAMPALAADFPVPGAFANPLLFLPTLGLFADPACRDCTLGQVRKDLRGGQALVLPTGNLAAQLMTLKTDSP
jgi:hypothetical protein